MRESGKFKLKNKDENKTREDKIKEIENKLSETEEVDKGEKHTIKVIKDGKEYYVRKNSQGGLSISRKEESVETNNDKARGKLDDYIKDLKSKGYDVTDNKEKNIVVQNKIRDFLVF